MVSPTVLSCHQMSAFDVSVQVFEAFEKHVHQAWVKETVVKALKSEAKGSETHVSVVIADDETVLELNRKHRGLNEHTDVLSFSYVYEGEYHGDDGSLVAQLDEFVLPPGEEDHSLGEVIVSYPKTVRQAIEAGMPVEDELSHLLVHGILHLLGHDHEQPSDEEVMKLAESRILGKFHH